MKTRTAHRWHERKLVKRADRIHLTRMLEQGRIAHVEAPGVIVNVRAGEMDAQGRAVTVIEIIADGNRWVGRDVWWIGGVPQSRDQRVRIVRVEEVR